MVQLFQRVLRHAAARTIGCLRNSDNASSIYTAKRRSGSQLCSSFYFITLLLSGDPMSAFAELTPLSAASHSTTLLQPNLSHITCEAQACVSRRIIRLLFANLLGRNCFSFGSARSNDYQLPLSNEVAPHHFIMYFDLKDSTLYIRSTCSQGILTSSNVDEPTIQTHNTPVAVVPSMRLQIGTINPFLFEIATFTSRTRQEYAAELEKYLIILSQRTFVVSIVAPERCRGQKRRASVVLCEEEFTKRPCRSGPTGRFTIVAQALLWALFWK